MDKEKNDLAPHWAALENLLYLLSQARLVLTPCEIGQR